MFCPFISIAKKTQPNKARLLALMSFVAGIVLFNKAKADLAREGYFPNSRPQIDVTVAVPSEEASEAIAEDHAEPEEESVIESLTLEDGRHVLRVKNGPNESSTITQQNEAGETEEIIKHLSAGSRELETTTPDVVVVAGNSEFLPQRRGPFIQSGNAMTLPAISPPGGSISPAP